MPRVFFKIVQIAAGRYIREIFADNAVQTLEISQSLFMEL